MFRHQLRLLPKLILAFALVAGCSHAVVAQEPPSKAPNANGKEAIDAKSLSKNWSFRDRLSLRHMESL